MCSNRVLPKERMLEIRIIKNKLKETCKLQRRLRKLKRGRGKGPLGSQDDSTDDDDLKKLAKEEISRENNIEKTKQLIQNEIQD